MVTITRLALVSVSFIASLVRADSLASIDHVVLFMQENRAFDHYFGSMAGVRGFSDPNVQINPNGKSVWYQLVNSSLTNDTDYLLPFYLNYLGREWLNATQCMDAGSNGYEENHLAYNFGSNDHWALNNTPWSWGYYKRSDLPVQFALAEGWTIGDMYQESVIASTNPNRVTWVSGSINVPGSPQTANEGGVYIVPGCESVGVNCYPLNYTTTPEVYQGAGVTWQVFQDTDNFDDNALAWFSQYQEANNGTVLQERGMSYVGLQDFYDRAVNGTLPMVSYIIGPTELSEHPPYSPHDGAWLQQQVVNAVTRGKNWNSTALIISYDETGGWGDHVTPYHSPNGTEGEWLEDPYDMFGYTFSGPGYRLPFYIISPWTRGGHVFTEKADHNSQIMFVEKWLAAKGINAVTDQMPAWRREHMSDLTAAFDFSSPNTSIPTIPTASVPHKDNKTGVWDGSSYCEAQYAVQRPPVPYANQTEEKSLVSEKGFKSIRGYLTEGRFLTFEASGYALTNLGAKCATYNATKAVASHDGTGQRWVIHETATDSRLYTISSAVDGRYIGPHLSLVSQKDALVHSITYLGGGKGYEVLNANGKYITIDTNGTVVMATSGEGFTIYSVT
ncbi:non-hemolytic phospholipase C precursor [Exophiala viscosa]|uniref:Non-hemolytic phospholipase C n=1 Tax=Exophiala viscosa TaxID=2486360 RepID=A0AAN6I9G2_9EURO|nr:non-hemolytic phospholipase C precursor [Exophiala viscosa]